DLFAYLGLRVERDQLSSISQATTNALGGHVKSGLSLIGPSAVLELFDRVLLHDEPSIAARTKRLHVMETGVRFGLRQMGRGDILDNLRTVVDDERYWPHVGWLGTNVGARRRAVDADSRHRVPCPRVAASLRRGLRVGRVRAGSRVLAAGDASPQPSDEVGR